MRKEDWPARLHQYIESVKNSTFAYGQFDCGLLAAGCIEAMTCEDFASELRGYTSAREALAASKRVCGYYSIRKLGEYLAAQHHLKEVPVLMAQRGDLAVVKDRRFGIVTLSGTEIYVPAKQGIARVPLTDATKVYRI
jgi:hypothetical protein